MPLLNLLQKMCSLCQEDFPLVPLSVHLPAVLALRHFIQQAQGSRPMACFRVGAEAAIETLNTHKQNTVSTLVRLC